MPRDANPEDPPLAQPLTRTAQAIHDIPERTGLEEHRRLVPLQVASGPIARPSLGPPPADGSVLMEESVLSSEALDVLRLYVTRMRRMVHSVSPGTVAPTARVLFDIYRLESGQSTANTAIHLTGDERRARILELARVVEEMDEANG